MWGSLYVVETKADHNAWFSSNSLEAYVGWQLGGQESSKISVNSIFELWDGMALWVIGESFALKGTGCTILVLWFLYILSSVSQYRGVI